MSYKDLKNLVKLVSYFVMGDGGIYTRKDSKNAKFIMNMKKENEDYILWVKEILEQITSVKLFDRKDYNTDGCIRKPQMRLETSPHPFFTKLRNRIYIDTYKGLDPHTLKLLDAEALAILYMCDGCLHSYKSKRSVNESYNVTLNLKRLSYGDMFLLKKELKEKLDLEWNIHKHNQYYYLYLRTKDIQKFMIMISPFVKESFKYKLVCTTPSLKDDDIV